MSPLEQIYAIVQALISVVTSNTAQLTDLKQKYAALQSDDDAKTKALAEAQQHQADSDSKAADLLKQLQALQASLTPATDTPPATPSPVTTPPTTDTTATSAA